MLPAESSVVTMGDSAMDDAAIDDPTTAMNDAVAVDDAASGAVPPPLTADLNMTAEPGGSLLDRLSQSSVLAGMALDKFGCWQCNHPCQTVARCDGAVRVSGAGRRARGVGRGRSVPDAVCSVACLLWRCTYE